MPIIEAKIKFLSNNLFAIFFDILDFVLDIIQTWPLFGTTFFTIQVYNYFQ
jgi:hypothetical protein